MHQQKPEQLDPIDREECERLMKIANRDLAYAETFKESGPPTILEGRQVIEAFGDVTFIKQSLKDDLEESQNS
jgi:hypothetical protein